MPKQLLRLDGRTLIEHCVAAFDQAPGIDEILVVMPSDRIDEAAKLLDGGGYRKLAGIIEGGTTRPGSTRRAIATVSARTAARSPGECGVLLHDAARPLVGQRIIADCVRRSARRRGRRGRADVGHHRRGQRRPDDPDTAAGQPAPLPDPAGLPPAGDPRAHELALADPDFTPTDDCGVVLRYLPDVPVHVVPGSERNMKITYPRDLAVAETLLRAGDGEVSS